jgi:hypothetical protein
MSSRGLLLGAAAILALGLNAATVQAAVSEEELGGMHAACDRGDKDACVRFGAALRENHDHEVEWRHSHPEWYR